VVSAHRRLLSIADPLPDSIRRHVGPGRLHRRVLSVRVVHLIHRLHSGRRGHRLRVSESVTLTGLVPGTTYQYRIVASNTTGTSTGADNLFATPAPGGASTLGNASVGDEISNFQSGLERVNPYALYWPGVARSLSMYLQPTGVSGTQRVQLVLYADQNGTPGAAGDHRAVDVLRVGARRLRWACHDRDQHRSRQASREAVHDLSG
jgi:hypothetical protein